MRNEIMKIITRSGKDGILQEELTKKYGISKSTVSTVLSKLEKDRKIIRRRVAGKSYRVWDVDFSPFPIDGILRIGILKATEYPSIFILGEEMQGLKIRVYENAFSLTKDLAEGFLDLGCSPLITQVLFSLVYRSIRINAGCGFNGGGIVKRKTPKIFGSSELSTMEFSLRRYMEEEKINGEIRYSPSPEKMIESLRNGAVDAIAIWEPYLSKLEKEYEIIRFENIFGDYPCCTLASNIRIEESEKFREFLENYKRVVDSIEERKEKAVELQNKYLGFSKEDVENAFYGYKYNWKLNLRDAINRLEEFGIKLTAESRNRIFNLL